MDEEKDFSAARDAFNNAVAVGCDFDVSDSPQAIGTTPVAIDVSDRIAEILVMPDGADLKVGTDIAFADGYDLVPDGAKESFWVTKRDTIYVATTSGTATVYFRKVIL